MTTFNQAPYFDDYNEDKGFYKILFKPGTAVQTRELNQIQTTLQNQISRFGQNVFKEGSVVVPGNTTFDNNYTFVIINSSYNNVQVSTFVQNLVGQIVVGQTSGVIGQIVGYIGTKLFVRYQSGTKFSDNEIIVPQNSALAPYTVQAIITNATGTGMAFSVDRGIYFIQNQFAIVEPQTIVVDASSTTSSNVVGFIVTENIVTAATDSTLYDNAQGSPNFSAPGADRYQIVLTLSSYASGTPAPASFIKIAEISDGTLVAPLNNTNYNTLADFFATRLYDQSGDFTVDPFEIQLKEYRNNNRGAWSANTVYLAGDVVQNNSTNYVAMINGTSSSTAPNVLTGIQTDGSVTWIVVAAPYFNKGIYTPSNSDTLLTASSNASQFVAVMGAGKAFVKGYELTKIASSIVQISKPRTIEQQNFATINTEFDNYIIIQNVNSMVDFTTFPVVNLYDQMTVTGGTPAGSIIGNARIMNISYMGNGKYRCSLSEINLNAGKSLNRNVKQISYNIGTTYFTADISPVLTQLSGSVSAASSTVTGTGTTFLVDFVVGDYVQIGTQIVRIQSITNNNSMVVSTSVSATGLVYYRVQTALVGSNSNSLVFPLPNRAVANVRDNSNSIVTQYVVTESFNATSTSTGVVTISVKNTSTDTFAPTSNTENYLVVNTSTNTIENNAVLTLNASSQQLTATVAGTSQSYTIFATVNRVGAGTEKTKTLLQSVETFTSPAATVTLAQADGYVLSSVMMDSGTFATPSGSYTIDITSKYSFNNGQTLCTYNPSSIALIPNAVPPIAPIKVTYLYFAHSATGDYFTVNSYLATIDYNFIPYFQGQCLGDTIDFRPRIGSNGVTIVINGFPSVGYDLFTSYNHYLGRKDIITLDTIGNFADIQGSPSDNPKFPSPSSNSVSLYQLSLEPYIKTVSSSSILAVKTDNKVYTMADIANLDNRITNLEYYTSLSLVEQSTLATPLIDSNGLNLYKNGIAVDSFDGVNTISNVSSPDYLASMDVTNGILRSFYTLESVGLTEVDTNDSQRLSNGYMRTGNLITLPYTEVPYITQTLGTETKNVNPFAVYKFIGTMTLTPPTDNWFDVNYLPDQIVSVVNNYDAMNATLTQSGVLGTHWNAWQTTWSGVTGVTSATYSTRITDPSIAAAAAARAQLSYNATGGLFGSLGDASSYIGSEGSVSFTTTTTSTKQTRTGTTSVLVPNTTNTVTGTKLLSQTAIPYIRQRYVQYKINGLKPSVNYYTFFDDINITNDIFPATQIIFTPILGQSSAFNTITDIGQAANNVAARQSTDGVTVFSVGDVIVGATSGATAVVIAQEYLLSSSQNVLYVVNVYGTFTANEVINGSISSASVTLISTNTLTNCIATENGTAYGLMLIPNNAAVSFRCGTKSVIFTDSPTSSNISSASTYAFAQYISNGVLEVKQNQLTSTISGIVSTTNVSQNQTLTSAKTTSQDVTLAYIDPISQAFLVTNSSGLFATSVDIYFSSKSKTVPVTLDIMTVVNGYPSTIIVPYSSVTLFPSSVNISSNGSIATRFTFVSPVYLNAGTQYAIRLISNSNDYNVYIATLGQQDLVTGQYVSSQPYAGNFFESKNATTWTANNQSVLKFIVNQAQFSTNASTFQLTNMPVSPKKLLINPFTVISGSNIITVKFISHGLSNGSTVTISGASSGYGINAPNGNFTVSNCTLDTFTIVGSSNATMSGNFGGSSCMALGNYQYDTIMPNIQDMLFTNTSIKYQLKTMSGKSYDGTETPYILAPSFSDCSNNSNISMSAPAIISSQGTQSLYLQCTMMTNDPSVSPVIDMSRVACTLIQNKINAPATFDETAPNGSLNASKYVTNTLKLANPASNIHIMFGYTMYTQNDIFVYYRSALSSTGTNISSNSWVQILPDAALIQNSTSIFNDASYTLMDISSFDAIQLKIVMRSTNEALVPLITDLRVILTS